MKIKSLFAAVMASAMAFVACEQEKTDLGTPSIALSLEEVTLEAAGGEATVDVTATRDWTVTFDETADWLVVDPASGTASADAQQVTVSALSNEGYDREVSVEFSIGMQKKFLTVKQVGPKGSTDALVIYSNDFDKTKAEKGGSGWSTYLDSFDGWMNAKGTGLESVTYGFDRMTARTNSGNGSAGSYSDYVELGASGMNYLWFGSGAPYFAVKNIALPEGKTDFTLSFGTERYLYQAADNTFNWDEFKVYVSVDGNKWVKPAFEFAGGKLPNGRWDLASSTFTVPAGTASLSVYFASSLASAYAIDDVKLVMADAAGTVLDFANGEEFQVGETTTGGDNTGGDNTGGNTQTWPTDVYTKVSQVTSGKKYVIFAEGIVAKPIEASRTYGYLYENSVTPDSEGKITTSDEYGFVFTAVEGGYTIMQSDGRFLYVADDDYKNFNVSKEPTSGHVWKVEAQSDGTFKITNVLAPKWIQFSSNYNSYGAYRETQDASFLPYLYEGTKDLTVQEGDNTGGGNTDGGNTDGGSNGGELDPDAAWSYLFAKGDLGDSYSAPVTKTLNGAEWSFAMTGSTYLGWDSNGRGLQMGKSKEPASEVTLSTSGISGNIKKIVVNTAGAKGTDAELVVKVGETAMGSPVKATATATDYTFEAETAVSGAVELKWTLTTAAVYIKSISVYTE